MYVKGFGTGQGSGTKIVQRTRAKENLLRHKELKWLIHNLLLYKTAAPNVQGLLCAIP